MDQMKKTIFELLQQGYFYEHSQPSDKNLLSFEQSLLSPKKNKWSFGTMYLSVLAKVISVL